MGIEIEGFVAFENVRVITATAQTLQCRIGPRNVWLPRMHVIGSAPANGARCRLLVRHWVARDRHLLDGTGATASPLGGHITGGLLRLVQRGRHDAV